MESLSTVIDASWTGLCMVAAFTAVTVDHCTSLVQQSAAMAATVTVVLFKWVAIAIGPSKCNKTIHYNNQLKFA